MENWINEKPFALTVSQNEVIRILYLARVEKDKGVDEFIRAIAEINMSGIRVEVDLCGNGSYMSNVLELIEVNGLKDIVNIHGFVKGKVKEEMFKRADIFVFPSHYEGYPNSVIEALSYGNLVVASRIEEIQSVIFEGENGLLFEKGNVDDLSRILSMAIVNINEYSLMRANAVKYIKLNNSTSRPIEFLENLK